MVIVGKYTSFLWMVFLLFHLSMGSIKLYTVSLPANLPWINQILANVITMDPMGTGIV